MIRTPWSTFTEVRKRYYLETLSDIEKILKNPEIASISVMDYREYDPELCWNGGRYAYGEIYRRADPSSYPDTWCKVYTTSSDLYYCPKCGQFHNHGNWIGFLKKNSWNPVLLMVLQFLQPHIPGEKRMSDLFTHLFLFFFWHFDNLWIEKGHVYYGIQLFEKWICRRLRHANDT